MKLIGSNGYDVGSPEYFKNINENTVIGQLMEEFSEGLACSDYADVVDKLCKRVTEVIEEVYWDLRKYADVLPYFPKEERENTLKSLQKLNEILKLFYFKHSSKLDECKSYLTLSSCSIRLKSNASVSEIEKAAKRVEDGGSVRMSYSTAFELVRKALDYGISYTAGDDLTKMTFFNDILEGKDRDFLQDVYNCLRFKKDKSSLYGKCFKTILSRDYIQALENKVFGKMYYTLRQYNSYYETLKDNLSKIYDILKLDISNDGQIYERNYVDNFLKALRSMDKFFNTDLGAKFKDLSLDFEVVDITDELHKMMDDAAVEYKYNAGDWIKGSIEETYNFVKNNVKEFISIVESNSKYDLKNQSEWKHDYFIYEGKEVRRDAPGNIVFGYVAKLFGFPEVIAKGGAGIYQIYSHNSDIKYLFSFFDDPYDQEMIKLGFDYYDRTYRGP